MVGFATPLVQKNPLDQAKDSLNAVLHSLDQFSKGVNPQKIAGDFVKSMEKTWDLNRDPNLYYPMGRSGNSALSLGQATSALGLYAKVFKAGLDIAYGTEPNEALNRAFKTALHDLNHPHAPKGSPRPWDDLRRL